MVASGAVSVADLITERLPLADVPKAIETVAFSTVAFDTAIKVTIES